VTSPREQAEVLTFAHRHRRLRPCLDDQGGGEKGTLQRAGDTNRRPRIDWVHALSRPDKTFNDVRPIPP
jgi:hypothetical protein